MAGDYIEAKLIDGYRNYGYTLQTSVADLVDNSLDANCSWVQVAFNRNAEQKVNGAFFLDNGDGMSEKELFDAMCFGVSEENFASDEFRLGRFGFGLKTASFAHAKKLIVASKKKGDLIPNALKWDLENTFRAKGSGPLVTQLGPAEVNDLSWSWIEKYLMPLDHGTIVIWEKIDGIINDRNLPKEEMYKHWMRLNDIVKTHLGMVFNKKINNPDNPIKIYSPVRSERFETIPWSPSCRDVEGVEKIIDEKLAVDKNDPILIRGYILPKYDELSKINKELVEGPEGMNGHQGFTIYRNNRVLVSGDWLSLEHNSRQIKRSARYNRIRIILELPQTMDELWDFDVKKSQILPPILYRKPLEKIFARMLEQLEKTQKKSTGQRRNIFSDNNTISPWKINKSLKGVLSAKLFRGHKIFEDLKKFNNIKEDVLEDMLEDIESSFPFNKLFDEFTNANHLSDALDEKEFDELKKDRDILLAEGKTNEEVKLIILGMPKYQKYISEIIFKDKLNELKN